MKIKTHKVKTIFAPLKEFCHLYTCEEECISVTEWHNGEGWDVEISREHGNERFGLIHGELEALNCLTTLLRTSE